MFVPKFPGSTNATAATKAGPTMPKNLPREMNPRPDCGSTTATGSAVTASGRFMAQPSSGDVRRADEPLGEVTETRRDDGARVLNDLLDDQGLGGQQQGGDRGSALQR